MSDDEIYYILRFYGGLFKKNASFMGWFKKRLREEHIPFDICKSADPTSDWLEFMIPDEHKAKVDEILGDREIGATITIKRPREGRDDQEPNNHTPCPEIRP